MRTRKRRRSSLNFGRTRRKFNVERFKYIMTWVAEIAGVILLAFVLVSAFGIRTNVVGQAMSDTLENGDEVFINKLAKSPDSGDVIVFLPNGNEKSHYYIRRVIGVPGDRVLIKDGAVYINGELYNEKIDVAAMEDEGIAGEEITLAEDEYFVLGDNRNNSEDSRYANIGNIKKEYIVGLAWYRVKSEYGTGFIH
ncbi:MAG: signal peptidase I [Agathobacter sp.]|nr:signal peptidase I [Agathobacter sp.]